MPSQSVRALSAAVVGIFVVQLYGLLHGIDIRSLSIVVGAMVLMST